MKGKILFKKEYLVENPDTGWIQVGRPIIITFEKDLIKKLYETYSDNQEVGGLLISTPKLNQNDKELQVINVIPIPNLSNNPGIYDMDKSKAQEIINQFHKRSKLFIPLTFHTHPIDKSMLTEKVDDFNFFPYYEQSLPSDEDKVSVNFFNLTLYGNKFCPPDILVVRNQIMNKLFLGFYDIRHETGIEETILIMKEEGMKIVLELAIDIGKSIVEKFDKPWKKLLVGVLIGIGIGIFVFLYIKFPTFRKFIDIVTTTLFQMGALELLFNLFEIEISKFYELHPYFKQTKLGENAKLMIPESLEVNRLEEHFLRRLKK